MQKFYSLILLTLVFTCGSSLAKSQSDYKETATFVFENVNVIPMTTQEILRNQTVIIKNGKIHFVGSSTKVKKKIDALVIDGYGNYLIPGLFDMHMHFEDEQTVALPMYIANGVTTIQSMEGSPWHIKLRNKIAQGKLLGPRVFTTGPTTADAQVNSPEEAEAFVRKQKKAGYDAIKQYGNGSDSMSLETYKHLITTAKKLDMRVVGHAPRNLPFDAVLRAQQDSIDHTEEIYYTYRPISEGFYKLHVDFQFGRIKLDEYRKKNPVFPNLSELTPTIKKLAQEVKKSGVAITPTLTMFRTIWRHQNSQYLTMLNDPELQYVEPLTRVSWGPKRNWYRAGWAKRRNELNQILGQSLELQKMMVKEFANAGVPLMSGTDAQAPFVYPGFNLHKELKLFVESGVKPFDALKAATITPAKFLGIDTEVGTIEVGKQADLVLLDANPLNDIGNTKRISGVFLRGRWFTRKDLDQMLKKISDSYEPLWYQIQNLQKYLAKEDIEKSFALYKKQNSESEKLANYLRREIDNIGYEYVREKQLNKALKIMKLNNSYFPKDYRTWNALAEVYVLMGKKALAIKHYQKSLELNPKNSETLLQLKKLQQIGQ